MKLQSKFGYCIITQTLNIALCKRGGIKDKQADGRTIQLLDASSGFFQAAGKKIMYKFLNNMLVWSIKIEDKIWLVIWIPDHEV